jgi:hypothetical protein
MRRVVRPCNASRRWVEWWLSHRCGSTSTPTRRVDAGAFTHAHLPHPELTGHASKGSQLVCSRESQAHSAGLGVPGRFQPTNAARLSLMRTRGVSQLSTFIHVSIIQSALPSAHAKKRRVFRHFYQTCRKMFRTSTCQHFLVRASQRSSLIDNDYLCATLPTWIT